MQPLCSQQRPAGPRIPGSTSEFTLTLDEPNDAPNGGTRAERNVVLSPQVTGAVGLYAQIIKNQDGTSETIYSLDVSLNHESIRVTAMMPAQGTTLAIRVEEKLWAGAACYKK